MGATRAPSLSLVPPAAAAAAAVAAGVKESVPFEQVAKRVPEVLAQMQSDLFQAAKVKYDSCIEKVTTWEAFMAALNNRHMALAPWADEEDVEEDVKKRSVSSDAMVRA